MKKFSAFFPFVFFILISLCFLQCNSGGGNNDQKAVTEGLSASLRKNVNEETAKAFEQAIKNSKDDPIAIQYFGHYAYLNRQLETAAWLYALAAEKKPDDVSNQSNLALSLHELSLKDSTTKHFLQSAIELLEKAAKPASDNAVVQNNLGYAYYQQYLNSKDASWLEKAAAAFNKAIGLDPKNAIYHSHLADVLAAMNKTDEAVSHLNDAFRLEPLNGVFINSASHIPAFAAAKSSRSYCDSINFDCDRNCPHSIIGRLQFVTCEMAQQDARLACMDGKPYVTTYNCDEQMPSTGFMIPGLNSGIGIITPWGKLIIMVQGGGKVDVKIEVHTPVPGITFTATGTYNPSSGVSVTQFGAQASVNLYNQGAVAPMLNSFNMGPASVKVTAVAGGKENGVQLEAYDTPVYNIH